MRVAFLWLLLLPACGYAAGPEDTDAPGIVRERLLQKDLTAAAAERMRIRRELDVLERMRTRDRPDPSVERQYQYNRHRLGKRQREIESLRHQSYMDGVTRGVKR